MINVDDQVFAVNVTRVIKFLVGQSNQLSYLCAGWKIISHVTIIQNKLNCPLQSTYCTKSNFLHKRFVYFAENRSSSNKIQK